MQELMAEETFSKDSEELQEMEGHRLDHGQKKLE